MTTSLYTIPYYYFGDAFILKFQIVQLYLALSRSICKLDKELHTLRLQFYEEWFRLIKKREQKQVEK